MRSYYLSVFEVIAVALVIGFGIGFVLYKLTKRHQARRIIIAASVVYAILAVPFLWHTTIPMQCKHNSPSEIVKILITNKL